MRIVPDKSCSTKRKMMRRIKENPNELTMQSYLGMLSHGDSYKLKKHLLPQDVFIEMMKK